MSDFDEKKAFGQYLASLEPQTGPFADQTPAFPQPVDGSVEETLDDSMPASRMPASLPRVPKAAAEPAPASVKDYIGKRVAEQEQALKAAQVEAGKKEGMAGIAEGLGQLTAGMAHADNFNPASFKYLHDKANRPVENVLTAQKSKTDAIQQAGLEQKAQRQSALDDPSSVQSTIARRLAAQSLKRYNEDPSIVEGMSASDLKEFLEKPLDQMENRASREAIMKLKSAMGGQKPSVGQQSLDRNYAKDYDAYTSKGRNNAATTIQRLEALAGEMEGDQGLFESGGGAIKANLPDWARSSDAIRRRDSARNFANATLKELFGGQLSDAEREAAAREFYNEKLDNKENAKIIRQKVLQLKDNMNSQDEKAAFFESNNQSLRGYKPMRKGPSTETKTVGGKTYVKVPGGWQEQ